MRQLNASTNTCIYPFLTISGWKSLFIFLRPGENSPPPPSLHSMLVESFPFSSPVHYHRGNRDLAVSQNLPFHTPGQWWRTGLGRKVHTVKEVLSPLHFGEGNPTCHRAVGTTSHWAGLSPLLCDIMCISYSLLLCHLKFGRPCLSEILQALAPSLCLYLAQTY